MLARAQGAHVVIQGPEADSHRCRRGPGGERRSPRHRALRARSRRSVHGAARGRRVHGAAPHPGGARLCRRRSARPRRDSGRPGEEAARSPPTDERGGRAPAHGGVAARVRASGAARPRRAPRRVALSHARRMLGARPWATTSATATLKNASRTPAREPASSARTSPMRRSVRLAHRALYASPSHRGEPASRRLRLASASPPSTTRTAAYGSRGVRGGAADSLSPARYCSSFSSLVGRASSAVVCGVGLGGPVSSSRILNSTRRLVARPSSVVLSAMGRSSP